MVKLEKNLPFETKIHNADKPQPKRLTRENRANREGNDWKIFKPFDVAEALLSPPVFVRVNADVL
jgi:hypothetical protein